MEPRRSLARKIRDFVSHPRETLAHRSTRVGRKLSSRWCRFRVSRVVDMRFLTGRPSDAQGPDWLDQWFLYTTLRRLKPRSVLEFGSGISTVVMAQALYDNHARGGAPKASLFSVDDIRRWADATRVTLPAHLTTLCTVHHLETEVAEYAGSPCVRHQNLPPMAPDFIYLDGPSFKEHIKVSVDILDLEPALPPGTHILIDGRKMNTDFLRAHLTRRWSETYRIWANSTVLTLLP